MKKFKTKLIFTYTTLIISLTMFLLFYVSNHIRNELLQILKHELVQNINSINSIISINKIPLTINQFQNNKINKLLYSISKYQNIRITIIKKNGVVVYDSHADPLKMDNHKYRPEVIEASKNKSGYSIRYSKTINHDLIYMAVYFNKYYIRTSKSLEKIEKLIFSVNKNILYAGFIILIISLIINFIFIINITRPINDTIVFIKKFFKGDLKSRILNYKDNEIGYLQKSINDLADTIEQRINEITFEKNKLSLIIQNIADPIAFLDFEGNIQLFNNAFINLFEYPGDIINKKYFSVIRNSYLNSQINNCLTNNQNLKFEINIENSDFIVYLSPITSNKLIGLLLIMHNITEQKKIQRLKTELIGNLSHELKTPISIIKGYIETIYSMLTSNISNNDILKYLNSALLNIDRLNSIINDMLKLNKLETGYHQINEQININNIIVECIEILQPKLDKKNIKVNTNLDNNIKYLKSNQFLAEEIFFNIIDNAIIYNRQNGKINIETKINDLGNTIIATIEDTGIGISADDLPKIFERFYRADKGRSRDSGGTGLGLSIVKHASQILKWNIDVESNKKGSIFKIIIPYQAK